MNVPLNESITMSLRVATNEARSPIVRIADYYLSRGWKISQILGCDPILCKQAVLSMLDLDPCARVRCDSLDAAEWIIAVDAHRFREGESGRRDVRVV